MTKDEFLAIDRFICENNNFESVVYKGRVANSVVPRFIVEANWTCDIGHMVDKWHEACRCADCYGFFNKFYCEMDNANKEAMIEWILENRKDGYVR